MSKNAFCGIDGFGYQKDAVLTNFRQIDYLDQYRVLKLFYKEHVGEELLNPPISYNDRKDKYPTQVLDPNFQVDHVTPTKIQLFEELNTDPANANARFFVLLFRHRQKEMTSDGHKIIEVKVL